MAEGATADLGQTEVAIEEKVAHWKRNKDDIEKLAEQVQAHTRSALRIKSRQ